MLDYFISGAEAANRVINSPEKIQAASNIVAALMIAVAAQYAFIAAAFYLLREAVGKASWRPVANLLAIICAILICVGIYNTAAKGHVITLGNMFSLVTLYYLFDLHMSQGGGFLDKGSRTVATILMWLNILFAIISLASISLFQEAIKL